MTAETLQADTAAPSAPERRANPAVLFVLLTVAFDAMAMGVLTPSLPDLVKNLSGGSIADAAKLANIRRELDALNATWATAEASRIDIDDLRAALRAVNERLWVIEDDIRLKEKAQAFDAEFIRLARAVYFENDERARIKRDINLRLGSAYVEEKSYQDYRAPGEAVR